MYSTPRSPSPHGNYPTSVISEASAVQKQARLTGNFQTPRPPSLPRAMLEAAGLSWLLTPQNPCSCDFTLILIPPVLIDIPTPVRLRASTVSSRHKSARKVSTTMCTVAVLMVAVLMVADSPFHLCTLGRVIGGRMPYSVSSCDDVLPFSETMQYNEFPTGAFRSVLVP
eukprot:768404-Hanusia_phi.AAC.1